MTQDIETLESRRMLSAVAAHVVGSTLKITGTPHNDSIVVSLKGKTLAIQGNGATQTLPAKGIKLIDLRGGGGKDKLQVAAPIAYKLNGGNIRTPLVASLDRLQAAPASSQLLASSGTMRTSLPATGTTTTESAGTVSINPTTPLPIGNPVQVNGSLLLGGGILSLASRASTGSGYNMSFQNSSGSSSTSQAIQAITAGMGWSGWWQEPTYSASNTIATTASNTLFSGGTVTFNGANSGSLNAGSNTATLTINASPTTWYSTSLNVGNTSGLGGSLTIANLGRASGGTLSLDGSTLTPGTPMTLRIGGVFLPSPGSPAALFTALYSYLQPTMTVEFETLPTPEQAPRFVLIGSETIYLDHPLSFAVTLGPAAAIAPGTYPLIGFADGAFVPADISGMQFKSDALPAQYTYTLALNTANRTIDLVIADAPAAST